MELFYYTSTDTMQYVLTGENIYATNISYMNDSEEYINGLEELHRLFQQTELIDKWKLTNNIHDDEFDEICSIFTEENLKACKQEKEYYSISFCKRNDLLSQWAIYARESGVSIKMRFDEKNYKFYTNTIYDSQKAEWVLIPKKVYYFTYESMKNQNMEKEYEDTAYKILNQMYGNDNDDSCKDTFDRKRSQWRYISAFVKRYDFYQEEEYRLVFEPNVPAYPPEIKYRTDKKVLKPYLDIKCEKGWPIWEIMIGPGFNQQVVFESVEHFLNHAQTKVGIHSIEDYIKRVIEYLKPCQNELNKCSEYQTLLNKVTQEDWIKENGDDGAMEDVVMFCSRQIQIIVDYVLGNDENNIYSKDLKLYFQTHHFTRSGVVLSKSSIPYIF